MPIIKRRCEAGCGGTGVYSGMLEAEDEAVVCLGCRGTGCEAVSYVPFTKRKRRRGIKTVRLSRGSSLITGAGGVGDSVPYAEFLKGKLPGSKKGSR